MKRFDQHPQFLTVPEAAKFCGVSRNTLYTWVRSGKLGAYTTPGRTNLIRPSDLVNFMQTNGMFVPESLLEFARTDEKMGPGKPDADAPKPGGVSVLVVDDDSSSRALVTRALGQDAAIYEAETGYEALHLLTKNKGIQVVLLDLLMPGQHGLQTLSEIRRMRPDCRVLVMTGFSSEIPEEMRNDGTINGILEKPVEIQTLRTAMRAAVDPAPSA